MGTSSTCYQMAVLSLLIITCCLLLLVLQYGRGSRDVPRESCLSDRVRPEHHVLPPPVISTLSIAIFLQLPNLTSLHFPSFAISGNSSHLASHPRDLAVVGRHHVPHLILAMRHGGLLTSAGRVSLYAWHQVPLLYGGSNLNKC